MYDYKPIPEHEVKILCDKVSKPNTNILTKKYLNLKAREILGKESNV